MNTIYISEKEFHIFLHQHYLIITKKHFEVSKSKTVHVKVKTFFDFEKSSVMFLSVIESISLSNEIFAPQLRVLYGIPSGLLHFRQESLKTVKLSSDIQLSESDKLFIFLRRALLFMQVWTIKNMDTSDVEENLTKLFTTESVNHFAILIDIVKTTATLNDFPEIRPKNLSLDDSAFDYQINWFGRTLCKYLLNGERMKDDVRNWFLNCISNQIIPIPEVFVGYESLITGYILALKAYNKGKNDVEYILQLLDKTTYVNQPLKMEILSVALFFIGLLENKADRYFMTSGAGELFYSLEKIAFLIGKQIKIKDSFIKIEGYEPIRHAMLHAVDNCVQYYKIKNPSIAGKEFYEYKTTHEYCIDKITVIEPGDVVQFFRNHRVVYNFSKILEKKLLVTQDRLFYQLLSKLTNNVLHVDETNKLNGSISEFELSSKLYTDSKLLMRFFKKKSMEFNEIDSMFADFKNEWILITGDYKIREEQKKLLIRAASVSVPQKVYLFNFAESKINRYNDLFGKEAIDNRGTSKIKKKLSDISRSEDEVALKYNNSTLQAEVKSLFPQSDVRIVSKDSLDTPWEMVNLGIGLLQDTKLPNCTIIETRSNGYQPENYITIARCFSDIIIYDEKQRYMFLNL